MKRLLLFAALAAVTVGTTSAQNKPAAGEKTLEVNLAPLGGSPISIGGIRFRSFKSETSAFRMSVFLGYGSESEITQDEDSEQNLIELKDQKSSLNISLQPGIEKHLAGTDRLSPYMGALLAIGYGMTTEKEDSQQPDEKLGTTITKTGNFSVGLNGLAGFDYYVASKLYIGSEIGIGVALSSDMPKKISYEGIEGAEDSESKEGTKSSLNFGPNVQAQIRLGWVL